MLKIYLKQSPEKYNIYSDNRVVFKFLKMILIDNGSLSQTNKILIQSPRMNHSDTLYACEVKIFYI